MTLAMAGYVTNDAAIKLAAEDLPLFQAIFLRGLVASCLVVSLAWASGALRYKALPGDRGLIALRVVGEIGATCCFLTALFNMPIANASAIMQVTGLVVTLVAAIWLRERVGWRRSLAIAIGFIGVLLIVRPGSDGFNIYALAALAAVGFITLRDLATRQFSATVPGLAVTALTAVTITVLGGVVTLIQGWQPVEWSSLSFLVAAAVFILIGYNCGIQAMRTGEVAVVVPFRYLNLLWAMLLGYLVFSEVPGPWTIAGATLVVGAGLYTLWREHKVARG